MTENDKKNSNSKTLSLRGTGGSVRMNLSHGRSKSVLIETKRKKIILPNKIKLKTENEINTGKILFNLKEHISRELEDVRNNGVIKSSLDADIELSIESRSYIALKEFETELKFIFISSKFSLLEAKDGNLQIKIRKSNEKKCERCWHRDETVGTITEHNQICQRCYSNIFDSGEVRTLG